MRTSSTGVALIKKFEGLRVKSYRDAVGVWTIGYGHTAGVKGNQTINRAKAEEYLKADLVVFEKAVNALDMNLTQNQFDALVSFAFNCGTNNLKTLCKNRTLAQIADAILLYNKAGGEVLRGLKDRRRAERELFLKGMPTPTVKTDAALYRVRKAWADKKSQIGAYAELDYAKKAVDAHPGYKVYDSSGKRIYPKERLYASCKGRVVKLGDKSTTVWDQHKCTGDWSHELDKHGCGICCAAMANNLKNDKQTTPEKLMSLAVKKLGERKSGETYAISTNGIVTILKDVGCSAHRLLVTNSSRDEIKKQIKDALKNAKPVICWTYPHATGDPFGDGHHYVLAVGLTKDGKVVVANNGSRGPTHVVDVDELCKYLYRYCNGKDHGWLHSAAGSAGVVVVG